MRTSPQVLSTNRHPTQDEMEHAANLLRSLGNNVLAKLVETSVSLEMDSFHPIVVNDFSAVDDNKLILLVSPGTYEIPSYLLEKTGRYIIGLALNKEQHPVLILQGSEQEIYNTDTLEQTTLCVCQSYASMSGVIIDAGKPTVLETNFGTSKQFSDMFFQVEWRENADALNRASMTFYHGREWAIDAFGSFYRKRNGFEKGLDTVHEGVMNAIDNTFRPLARFGKKLDQVLGL